MEGRREGMRSLSSCGGAERACLRGFASIRRGMVVCDDDDDDDTRNSTHPSHTYTSYTGTTSYELRHQHHQDKPSQLPGTRALPLAYDWSVNFPSSYDRGIQTKPSSRHPRSPPSEASTKSSLSTRHSNEALVEASTKPSLGGKHEALAQHEAFKRSPRRGIHDALPLPSCSRYWTGSITCHCRAPRPCLIMRIMPVLRPWRLR